MESNVDTDVMYKLGSMESLLKTIDQKLTEHMLSTKEIHANHEDRIIVLEKAGVRTNTIAAMVGTGAGLLAPFFLRIMHLSG